MIINSRYRIENLLGSGRNSVYLATDLKSKGKKYALKIILQKELVEEELLSLKNEFRLLRGLNHPNIVQVFEFDKVYESDDDSIVGSYYYVSEFIEGKNLYEFFDPPLKESQLEEFLFALNQICGVLYYIHQNGIIHYDIRPENILITRSNDKELTVKLIDFGFSILNSKNIRGTPDYLSPEFISGMAVDYRADLYSLGATLYHILTGNPPFASELGIDVLKKKLEEKPSDISDNYPAFLKFIINKLLETSPENRFSNALEIIDFLPEEFRIVNKIWPIPKTFFAWEKEFQQTVEFTKTTQQDYSTLLLISEKRIGKSFFLQKVVDYLSDANESYFYLTSSESEYSTDNFLLILLKKIENILNESQLSKKEILREKISFLKKLNYEIESPSEKNQNIRVLLAEILIELAKEIKYIVVIDDFHRFDTTIKNFFYFIYPSLIDNNIKFIISIDTSFIRSGDVNNFQKSKELILAPLQRKDIYLLLKSYFNMDFPYEEVVELLVNFTDQTPGEIGEFLTSLIITDLLIYDSKGFRINHALLEKFDLENLFGRAYKDRFETLTQNQKLILQVLSLIDIPLKLSQLNEILDYSLNELKNDIGYLNIFGWLEYYPEAETCYLPKGKLRNFILNEALKLKDLVLTLIEYFIKNSYPPYIIAELYERVNYKEESLQYYIKAVYEAERSFFQSSLEKYLQKCIELTSGSELKWDFMLKLARCYFNQSEFIKARDIALELIPIDRLKKHDRFDLYLMLAIISFKTGDVEQAYDYFDQAYRLSENDEQKIEVEINQINFEVSQGNYTIAIKKCQNLLSEYEEKLFPEIKASIYNNLGIAHSENGFYQEAIDYFQNSLRIYESQNNKTKTTQLLMNIGNVYQLIGQKDKAIENWKEALKINESIGDIAKKALILNNIGISLFESMKIDEAITYYQESLKIFEKINDSFGLALVLYNIAESQFLLSDYCESLKNLEKSHMISEAIFDLEGQTHSLFLTGLNYLELNQMEKLKILSERLTALVESNKMQSTHLQYPMYLSGVIDYENKNLIHAEIKLNLARDLFKEYEKKYFYCKCTIDLMSLYGYSGNFEMLIKLFNELINNEYFNVNNILKAEAYLILGENSKKPGAEFGESSIYYHSEAFNLIETTYLGEVTWQVLLALGEEYLVRGAMKKGIDLVKKSKMVFDYLYSKIEDLNYKNSYLAHPKRKRALEKIEKILNNY